MGIVIVTVKPDGTTTVEADGIQGTSCIAHTNPFVVALGQAVKQSPKSDMYEQPITQKVQAYDN